MKRYLRLILAGATLLAAPFLALNLSWGGFYTYSNSLGEGQSDVRVRNLDNTVTNAFVTPATNFPSSGFNTNIALMVKGTWSRAGTAAFSKVGSRGAITNRGVTKGGDANDSGDPTLDGLVAPSTACPEFALDAEPIDVVDQSGQVDPFAYRYLLDIMGTDKGTALKVIWYDWLVEGRDPADTNDLLANGSKLAELLFVGPVNLENYDCIVVRSSRGREFIHVVTAGTAASLPFDVTCPADITVGCGDVLRGIDAGLVTINGGVAPYAVTYNPPFDQLSDAVTNTVTATVTDANGCTAESCQFNIIRTAAVTFNGFDSPIGGVGGSCAAPLRTIKRGSILPVKFSATCDGQAISTPPYVEVKNCVTGQLLANGDAIRQPSSVWHFNVDSSIAVFANATLEITVYLPGGYIKRAYIKLRG